MKINVYIGVMGSGKDYAARRDCNTQLAFADQLREDVWTMLNWWPKTDDEYDLFKKKHFGLPGGSMFTGRDLLQRYGTEVRRKEKDSHWVDSLLLQLERRTDLGETVGITDCRFPNEVRGLIQFVKQQNKELSDIGQPNFYELNFVHCDYHSDRYDAKQKHVSEKMAQEVLEASYCGSKTRKKLKRKDKNFNINKYMFEKYG